MFFPLKNRKLVLFYFSIVLLFQSSPYTWKHLLHWFLHQLVILTSQESRGSPFINHGWSPQGSPDRVQRGRQQREQPLLETHFPSLGLSVSFKKVGGSIPEQCFLNLWRFFWSYCWGILVDWGSGSHLEKNCSFKKFSLLKIDFSEWVFVWKNQKRGRWGSHCLNKKSLDYGPDLGFPNLAASKSLKLFFFFNF